MQASVIFLVSVIGLKYSWRVSVWQTISVCICTYTLLHSVVTCIVVFVYITIKSLHVSYSWSILLLQFEGLQHCSQWLSVALTKRGFSYKPTSDTEACVSRTTFPQVTTLQRWDILYNEEVDLFLRTSLSIGGVVTCTRDTETGYAFRLHVSKSIWKRVLGRLTSAG